MSCQKFYNAKTFTGVYFFLISIYKSKLTCIQFQDVLSFFFTWFALRTIKFCLKFSKLCPKVFFTEIFLPKLLKILYLKKNPNNWINIFYSRTEPVTSWKFAITWVNWFQQNYYRFSKINLNCKSNWLIFYQGAYFIFFFIFSSYYNRWKYHHRCNRITIIHWTFTKERYNHNIYLSVQTEN